MKTTLFLSLLFFSCQLAPSDPFKDALSGNGKTANIIHVIPVNSAAPDSLDFLKAERAFKAKVEFAKGAIRVGLVTTSNLDSLLFIEQSAYDSALARLKSSPRAPGFSLVRYTVNRGPDTLTAVLDPSFRVVWSR